MAITRNNYVFKGHKALLGAKYVTYGELELPLRYDIFPQSQSGFDWGYNGSAPIQLAFSMLYQVSNEEFAKKYAKEYANDVIRNLTARDWVMNASEVIAWVNKHADAPQKQSAQTSTQEPQQEVSKKSTKQKPKTNVVKKVCKELGITQKTLAEILEVPEGTVSSWAVKNEIPRLGKKAIEFYIQSQKNQTIVDSYKNFVQLLNVS